MINMNTLNPRVQILLSLILTLVVGLLWYKTKMWLIPAVFVATPLVLIGLLRFPFYIVITFIIFSYFRIHEAFPVLIPLHIPLAFSLASFFVLGWHIFLSNNIKVYWSTELTLVCLFLGWAMFGILFAYNKGAALTTFNGVLSKVWVMTIAICWLVRSIHHFRIATYLYVIAGVMIGAKAISNKLQGIGLVEGTRVTISRDIGSLIGDPNDLSLVMMFPMSFALSNLLQPNIGKFHRMLLAVAYIILFWAIIATQSRGGLMGIMAITGYFAFKRIKNKLYILAGGAILLPILLVMAGVADRSSGGAAEDGVDESAMGRIYAWMAAWGMALENPFTGVGINNFYLNYYLFSPHWDGKNHAAHSTWFQILGETGFVGLALFIALITMLFKRLWRTEIDSGVLPMHERNAFVTCNDGVFAGLIAFCVAGTFLTQGFTWPLYILLSMTVALAKILSDRLALEERTKVN
ncbi:oligosaccharide repeat unit polymerase [Moritella marina ATCC 15381]|uniref:Oligosaccharide repeat unit polymerase n=1 Tax=Moritella marina ATCC 15381 TaxID=1202962 RepID=A0A5J6WJL4_MORMI|nr:oligosaccharide repeat unit polymerase [Moritella marina]QFI38286.1 oligosaccharide repeat unit polymerase [Moritella marina ATCC 15381]